MLKYVAPNLASGVFGRAWPTCAGTWKTCVGSWGTSAAARAACIEKWMPHFGSLRFGFVWLGIVAATSGLHAQCLSFSTAGDFNVTGSATAMAAGDFNGDRRIDLAVGAANNNGPYVRVMLGQGNGSFAPAGDFNVTSSATAMAAGDFNGDGRIDLAVGATNNNGPYVRVMANTGSIGFSASPASRLSCPITTATFAVAAAGVGPFTYQWQIEDPSAPPPAPPTFINLVDGPIVLGGILIGTSSGAATPDWHIALAASAGGGGGTNRVRCVVTNTCGSVTSGPATLTICSADFNCDGELNPDDLADFVGAYFALPAMPAADFNGDGENNPDDLADYIGAFFAGC